MNTLEIHDLSKKFGTHCVIDHINLEIPEHCIYGFLGQNGAGKTTTMKLITGLLESDAGHILVCGEQVQAKRPLTNRFIGYLPDVPEFYGYMTPLEYLTLCGQVTGLTKDVIKTRSKELLALVGLDQERRKIKGFSRGMKQRLGIAQALLHEPKLLICDEPTSALDPIGRKELLDILSRVKEKTTVLFSTHILSDVERICDHVAILHQGHIVIDGQLEALKAAHRHDGIRISFCQEAHLAQCVAYCKQVDFITGLSHEELTCTLQVTNVTQSKEQLLSFIVANRLDISNFEVLEPTLEHLFLEVVSS